MLKLTRDSMKYLCQARMSNNDGRKNNLRFSNHNKHNNIFKMSKGVYASPVNAIQTALEGSDK